MTKTKEYFFCGIGGSGMLPLAMIVLGHGHRVEGSDRSFDQGLTPVKFDFLRSLGIKLHPQDGSGLARADQILVASAAVEETVPDVVAAKAAGASRKSRAELLASLFNQAATPIGVAGTSGKSTTTGMIGWILSTSDFDPTVMNGAVMKNFVCEEALFASALVGKGTAFVSEVDESDGSIAMYDPKIAVLNNIALDHKSMDELRSLFGAFIAKSEIAVLNLDNEETRAMAQSYSGAKRTYSLTRNDADFGADNITPQLGGISFDILDRISGRKAHVDLAMPGRHNVSNALAATGAAMAAGATLEMCATALSSFLGVRRRLELVGQAGGVTVIDDFAHNPDKIAASLQTLHEFPGRLLVMFQPHGFGPLKKMRYEFVACFAANLGQKDILLMPEPVYFGGTVDRSVSTGDIIKGITEKGLKGEALADRAACGERLVALAKPGDRIVVMGARDDTLSVFANDLLARMT